MDHEDHGDYSQSPKKRSKNPLAIKEGKKYLFQHQRGKKNLIVENADPSNVVYVHDCKDSTLTVKGKLNSITVDGCKNFGVIFDNLIACIEFINCQSNQMQVLEKVPSIFLENTNGCQIYLSEMSMDVSVVTSRCTQVNIVIPKGSGDSEEYPVPEQYKTVFHPKKGMITVPLDNK